MQFLARRLVIARGIPRQSPFAVALTLSFLLSLFLMACGGTDTPTPSPSASPPAPGTPDVEALLAQMTLDEKVGQMTQADRGALRSEGDIRSYFLGSVLSGGGSSPPDATAPGWAEMYDRY